MNPDLIYVAISGFGPEGPYADLPAYDTVIQGLGGFMKIQGSAEAPLPIQGVPADKTSGLTAAYATIAALFARERARSEAGAAVAGSGAAHNRVAGQRVDIPMIDAWAAFSYVDMLGPESYLPAEHAPAGTPNTADFFQAFQTLDGFVVFMLVEDSQFQGFCQAIEREDLIEEPDYANIVLRMIHVPALIPTLKAEVRKWTTADLVERARRFGAPVAPVNGLPEFLEDPQVLANGTFLQTEDGERGTVRQIRQPARYSETPASVRHLVPRLGEHGSAVLAEAGFAQAEIERLRADGVIL
jgi:crotonobetainyl-CoA:carnitine CoA-transferase CaiB-like acyl-CoA transferase